MTNAQKWVAGFLGLFLILFLLGRLTRSDEAQKSMETAMMEQQNSKAAGELDGMSLIKQIGCISCHGDNLQGTKNAPALVNVKEHWNRDALINYLRNPSSYSRDERFGVYMAKYPGVVMPSYNNRDVKDLGKLADYLLTR